MGESQRLLAESRQRLAGLSGRIAGLRQRLSPAVGAAAAAASAPPGGPERPRPFGGADSRPIDDVELKFEALAEEAAEKEGPEREKASS
jgi:hypothetical protein